MKFYGIENVDSFKPTNVDYFAQLEEAALIGLIKATKDGDATRLPDNYITEVFTDSNGLKNLVDISGTSVSYNSNKNTYYNPCIGSTYMRITTETLYNNSEEITRLVLSQLATTEENPTEQVYAVVSFDDGSSWSTSTADGLGLMTDFTGTSNGGGNYRLKIKFYLPPLSASWTTTSSLNGANADLASCGTTSDALSFCGYYYAYLDTTEIWNGSSWATTSSLNVAREYLAGCGTTSDALSFGGWNGTSNLSTTEIWCRSSWTTTSSLNVAKRGLAGCGSISDALSFGGYTGGYVDTTEIWNGSSWATTSSLNVAREYLAGCGTALIALSFGGWNGTSNLSTTEKWNGVSWVNTSSLNVARSGLAGCGTTSDALSFGGNTGSVVSTTETWNSFIWITINSLNQAKSELAGCGSISDALSFGGDTGGYVGTNEQWSGFQMYGFGVKIN